MKDRFRVQYMDGTWSQWLDKGTDISPIRGMDIKCIHTEEFMTIEQYKKYRDKLNVK